MLHELGVDPGDDPLDIAKQFLSRVEGDDVAFAPPDDAARVDAPEDALASDNNATPFAQPASPPVAVPPAPATTDEPPQHRDLPRTGKDTPPVEEKPPVDVVDEPEPHTAPVARTTDVDDERSREQSEARAERWHAELEHVRAELERITAERETAEREAEDVHVELVAAQAELAHVQEQARSSVADIEQRATERDEAVARRAELEAAISPRARRDRGAAGER